MIRQSSMVAGTLMALLVSACASHDVMPIRVPTASNMPSHSQDSDVTIHADAYTSGPRQEATFDETLTNEGVLAVEVLVVNRSAENVNGRPSDARFILSDGRNFAPVPAAAVADEFYSSGNIVGSAIAFGLIGALVSSGAEKSAASARRLDFQNKALNDVWLVPGEERHGFLYFALPKDVNQHRSATLRFDLRRGTNGAPIPIDVPLSIAGLDLAGSFDQTDYAASGSSGLLRDPAETRGAGSTSRNCLDVGFADIAECRDYLAAWDGGQTRAQTTSNSGTGNVAATTAPRAPNYGSVVSVVDPAETGGAGSGTYSRACLDPAYAELAECRSYLAAWNAAGSRSQTTSTAGTRYAAGITTAPKVPNAGTRASPVDPIETTGGQQSCTDLAFAHLPECHRWLEAWNAAQAEGRPPPSPIEALGADAAAPVPAPGAGPARSVEMAAFSVSLASYHDRNTTARSWGPYVARFPLLGAATTRIVPDTAADGTAAYILQGSGLTERQARTICDNMRRAYEYCEVARS